MQADDRTFAPTLPRTVSLVRLVGLPANLPQDWRLEAWKPLPSRLQQYCLIPGHFVSNLAGKLKRCRASWAWVFSAMG